MRTDSRLIGFTASRALRAVSIPDACACFDSPFPRCLLRPRAHPLSRSSPQSSFAPSPRSVSPFGPSFTCLGFLPSSRHHPSAATFREGFPLPRYVPSSRFRNAPTVFSALRLAGLFHPAATSRTRPFRGFSPRAATLPRRKEPAPLPLLLVSLTGLRRLPLHEVLGFEAFIHARPRSPRMRYSHLRAPLPSSGSSPPGSAPRPGSGLPGAPALDVVPSRLRLRARGSSLVLSVPLRVTPRSRLRSRSPARVFRAFPPEPPGLRP
jgi:hypothetical protein